jgi:chromate reductase
VVAVLILALCGSLQQKSGNLSLLQRAAALAPAGVEVSLCDGLRDLPLFNPDLEQDGELAPVASFRRAIASSDALLIACPEYGHSLPGALKNGIDWVIGTAELERKVVGVTASVNIADRGRLGLSALQQTLRGVSARIVGGEPIVRGPSFDRDLGALLALLIAEAEQPDVPPTAEFF